MSTKKLPEPSASDGASAFLVGPFQPSRNVAAQSAADNLSSPAKMDSFARGFGPHARVV